MAVHYSICNSWKPHVTCTLRGSVLQSWSYCRSKFYIAIGIFYLFATVILTLTFIYDLDLYSLEIYRMCESELPMSRLLKVIVWQTYIHTVTTEIIYNAALRGEGGRGGQTYVNNQMLAWINMFSVVYWDPTIVIVIVIISQLCNTMRETFAFNATCIIYLLTYLFTLPSHELTSSVMDGRLHFTSVTSCHLPVVFTPVPTNTEWRQRPKVLTTCPMWLCETGSQTCRFSIARR